MIHYRIVCVFTLVHKTFFVFLLFQNQIIPAQGWTALRMRNAELWTMFLAVTVKNHYLLLMGYNREIKQVIKSLKSTLVKKDVKQAAT